MTISNGVDYMMILGEYLNSQGFSVPVESRVAGSPVLIDAWQGFALRHAINLNDWPKPDMAALNQAQNLAVSHIIETHPELLAAKALATEQRNREILYQNQTNQQRYLAESEFYKSMDESFLKEEAKLNYAPVGGIVSTLSPEKVEKILKRAHTRASRATIPALSNNPVRTVKRPTRKK